MSSVQYILPPKAIPTYTSSSSGNYTVQLTNYGVTPNVSVSFFVSTTDAPNVFFDSRAMLPCYLQYKVPGTTWSLYCSDRTITNQDPTEDFIEVKALPDPSYTPAAASLAGVLKTIQVNITSVTSNLATQVSKESSDFASLSSAISSQTTSITTLNNNVTTLQNQLSALTTMVSSINTQVNTSKTNIASIKTSFNSMVGTANTNSSTYNAAGTVQMALGSNKTPQMQNLSTITSF